MENSTLIPSANQWTGFYNRDIPHKRVKTLSNMYDPAVFAKLTVDYFNKKSKCFLDSYMHLSINLVHRAVFAFLLYRRDVATKLISSFFPCNPLQRSFSKSPVYSIFSISWGRFWLKLTAWTKVHRSLKLWVVIVRFQTTTQCTEEELKNFNFFFPLSI